jgi:hypothetical protein
MTGHGNIRSYLHTPKINRESRMPMRSRNISSRPSDIPVQKAKEETAILKSSVLKEGKWPVSKCELTNRNLKQFINYINSIDLEKINQSNE